MQNVTRRKPDRAEAGVCRPPREIRIPASTQSRPKASAIPRKVTLPATMFNPSRVSLFSTLARCRPLLAISTAYGRVALVSARARSWPPHRKAAGYLKRQCDTSSGRRLNPHGAAVRLRTLPCRSDAISSPIRVMRPLTKTAWMPSGLTSGFS